MFVASVYNSPCLPPRPLPWLPFPGSPVHRWSEVVRRSDGPVLVERAISPPVHGLLQ